MIFAVTIARARLRVALAAALAVACANGAANAADVAEALRGSYTPSYSRWQGLYLGAQVGLSSATGDFSNSASDLVAFILRNTTLENEAKVSTWATAPKSTTSSKNFGVFAGYNFPVERELVIGFEATYTKMDAMLMTSTDTIARSVNLSTGYLANVSVTTATSLKVNDYATFRARAGYVAGQFLPYAFAGALVARVDVQRFASVSDTEVDITGQGRPTLQLSPNPTTASDNRSNAYAYGGVLGLGVDTTLLPNLFLRAEYEYALFAPISGIRANMQSVRVGLGLKF